MTTRLPPPFRGGPGVPQTPDLDLPADDPWGVIPDLGAPDDCEPTPDRMQQEEHISDSVAVVRNFLWGRRGVLVSGDTPVYYDDEDGRQRVCRPDCYVAFGVNPIAIRRRNGYFIRTAGKAPDFVLEVASESTFPNDLGPKRVLYARLGVGEYWRFDATGGEFYPEPLAGEMLVDGEYQPIEVNRDATGMLRGHSPTLGLDLCWQGKQLRFYDPVARVLLRNLRESESASRTERAARQAAEARASDEAAARQAAEIRASAEAAARQAAEFALASERARNMQLEEELRQWQSEGSAVNLLLFQG